MKKLFISNIVSCCMLFTSSGIIAQDNKYKKDSIEISEISKWVRIAKKEYPIDTLRQNISIFANSFWSSKENTTIIKHGMNSFWENSLQKNVKSFQGSFSFLVSFDDEGNVQKLSFSKNVPIEFISVVQNNFKNLLKDISHQDRLKGSFKNKKILLRLNLIWSFTNLQGLKDYIDDGLNDLEFNEEGSTLGDVLIAPSNLMSRQI